MKVKGKLRDGRRLWSLLLAGALLLTESGMPAMAEESEAKSVAKAEQMNTSTDGMDQRGGTFSGQEWAFSAFGANASSYSVSKGKNGYRVNADGSVQVWSTEKNGKLTSTVDGLAFYYTKLDSVKDNFVLKATVQVDSWTYHNGQEGFGLMAADRIGSTGDGSDSTAPFWNNAYMTAATAYDYKYAFGTGETAPDTWTSGTTSMKLGVGAIAKTGVPADWSGSEKPDAYTYEKTTLDFSVGRTYGAGTYNVIGNCTNVSDLPGTQGEQLTELTFKMERDNTGYQLSYIDVDGNAETKVYYDEKYFDAEGNYTGTYEASGEKGTLAQMDADNIYVGFFAARNATVTFKDIELTVTDAAADAVPRGRHSFAAFGNNIRSGESGYRENTVDDSVQLWTTRGGIKANNADGLAFYYVKLDPVKDNFVLKATLHVDSWTFTNGSEGFGLMVSDRVGKNGDGSTPFWNNSYMAAVTRVDYYWDKTAGVPATTGQHITMKEGICSIARKGVPAGWNSLELPEDFYSSQSTLEYSCAALGAGTYNLIGNCVNQDQLVGNQGNLLTDITFSIERNNSGYRISYIDPDGNTTSKMYYDEKYFDAEGNYTGTYNAPGEKGTLVQMDENGIYVGLFTAGDVSVMARDIELIVTDAAAAPEPEARERELVDPYYSIYSASNANSADYDLEFISSVPGYVTIKASDGSYVAEHARIDGEYVKQHFPVTLNYGANKFTYTMTPDADYEIGGEGTNVFLKSYDAKSGSRTVYYYHTFKDDHIYVSPEGTSAGTGTADDPVDIATALKYPAPGQTIVLAGGTYHMTQSVSVSRGIDGTAEKPIKMIADPAASVRPVFDFGQISGIYMRIGGNYWILQGFDVTRTGPHTGGIRISGNYNVVDSVNTYKNGDTGLSVSCYSSYDTKDEWPKYNLIKNCTSYLNEDPGYENADGFGAKITAGPGNVFDGCIAAYNADDGWDLFAFLENGSIGSVTIQNCIAYGNGYVIAEDGSKIDAGNGNGFKLGGQSLSGYHKLINCIAFDNKTKGIDANSCPDVQVENCISFNNGSFNVALYTGSSVENTDFSAMGVVSYRTENLTVGESLQGKGTQDTTKIYNDTNYYWDGTTQSSKNTSGETVSADWFESLESPAFGTIVGRNADGTIDLGNFLKLTDKAPENAGARDLDIKGAKSEDFGDDSEDNPGDDPEPPTPTEYTLTYEVNGGDALDVTNKTVAANTVYGTLPTPTRNSYIFDGWYTQAGGGEEVTAETVCTGDATIYAHWTQIVTPPEPPAPVEKGLKIRFAQADEEETLKCIYTGAQIKPEVLVINNGEKLTEGVDYTLKYSNNVNASDGKTKKPTATVTGKGNFTGSKTLTFEIKAKKIDGDNATENVLKGEVVTADAGKAVPVLIYNGTALKKNKDFTFTYQAVDEKSGVFLVEGKGNYSGKASVPVTIKNKDEMKKFNVTLNQTETVVYDGTKKEIAVTVKDFKDKNVVLNETEHYTVVYADNDHAGTAKVTVIGKGDYTGAVTKKFTIKPADDAQVDTSQVASAYAFQNKAVTLDGDIRVTNAAGEELTQGVDYKLTYSGNRKVGKAKCKVTFLGDYKSTKAVTKEFSVVKSELTNATKGLEIKVGDVAYTGSTGAYQANVYVSVNGNMLKKSDYTVTYYKDAARTQETKRRENYISIAEGQENATVYVKIVGRGNYAAEDPEICATTEYRVVRNTSTVNLGKVKVTVLDEKGARLKKEEYTGEAVTPSIKAEYRDKTKTMQQLSSDQYEILYLNNVEKGKAVIVLIGNGTDTVGSKTVTFPISAKNLNFLK